MKTFRSFIIGTILISGLNENASALSLQEATEQAWGVHNRLTGVPPSQDVLTQMASLIIQGQTDQAALLAMSSSYFYTSFILRTFSPDSNRAKLSDLPLTDFTATIAGIVRDNLPFDQLLYGDILYTAADNFIDFDPSASGYFRLIRRTNNQGPVADPAKVRGLLNRNSATNGRYTDNIHYTDLQTKFPINWETTLERRIQSQVYQMTSQSGQGNLDGRIPANEVLGVMTTRQAASEFFSAGTNRRVIAAIYSNFLCADMEVLHDTTISQEKIRRDIDRTPGGDPLAFVTKCAGCHAGMDAQAGALSFIDYRADQNRIVYDPNWPAANVCGNLTPEQIANNPRCKQYRQYDVYAQGHRHIDNTFENFWTEGQNASLGWRSAEGVSSLTSGTGANALGRIISATEAFTNCMAHRIFKSVCGRNPTPREFDELKVLAREIEGGISEFAPQGAANPYNLKALIARTTESCFGN